MKKITTLALALLMTLSMLLPASAAEKAPQQLDVVWLSGGMKINLSFGYLEADKLEVDKSDLIPVYNEQEKHGYINTKGEVVVPLEYDGAYYFSEGLAPVMKYDADGNEKCGFVNTKGEVVVPLEYDVAFSFSDGLAPVMKRDADGNEKWGYINTKGEVVVPLEYDDVCYFSEGLALVMKRDADGNRKRGYINTKGEVVVPLEYDDVETCGYIVSVTKGASHGFCINPYYTEDEDTGAKGGLNLPVIAAAGAAVIVVVLVVVLVSKKRKKTTSSPNATTPETIPCTCGAQNPPTAKFCHGCGSPVKKPGLCACGHQNPPHAKFCQECGTPLE